MLHTVVSIESCRCRREVVEEEGGWHVTTPCQIQLATGGSSRRNCHTQSLLLQPGHGLIRVHTAFFCTRALGPRWVQLSAPAGSSSLVVGHTRTESGRLHNSECARVRLSRNTCCTFFGRTGSVQIVTLLHTDHHTNGPPNGGGRWCTIVARQKRSDALMLDQMMDRIQFWDSVDHLGNPSGKLKACNETINT